MLIRFVTLGKSLNVRAYLSIFLVNLWNRELIWSQWEEGGKDKMDVELYR